MNGPPCAVCGLPVPGGIEGQAGWLHSHCWEALPMESCRICQSMADHPKDRLLRDAQGPLHQSCAWAMQETGSIGCWCTICEEPLREFDAAVMDGLLVHRACQQEIEREAAACARSDEASYRRAIGSPEEE